MAEVTICTDFRAQENKKSATVSIVSPSICHEVMGPDAMIAGVQPQLIQGIRRRDGIGEGQETTA